MVMGALYSACLFLGVNNASSVQPIVSIERTVFYRERAAGMYSPFSYAAAQVIGTFLKEIWVDTIYFEQIDDNKYYYYSFLSRVLWRFHTLLFRQFCSGP